MRLHLPLLGRGLRVVDMLFSPCETYLAVAYRRLVDVINLRTRRIEHTLEARTPMAFTPSGKSLLSASMGSVVEGVLCHSGLTRVEIWSSYVTKACSYYRSYGTSTAPMVVAWRDMCSGKLFARWLGHTHSLTCISTHPNACGWVVTGDTEGCVRVWSVSSGQDCGTLQKYGAVPLHVQPSSCGTWVYVYHKDHTLAVWEVHSGKRLAQYDFSSCAKHTQVFLDADRSCVWFLTPSGVLEKRKVGLQSLKHDETWTYADHIHLFAMSSLKSTHMWTNKNQQAHVYNGAHTHVFPLPDAMQKCVKAAVSEQGRYVAFANTKGDVGVFKKNTL